MTKRQNLTHRSHPLRPGLLGLPILAMVAVGAIMLGDSTLEAAPAADSGRALEVATILIEEVEGYQEQRRYSGELIARRVSNLSFEISGRIESILVDEGSVVTAGDTIARVDARRIEARRSELTAQRAQAVARLHELEAGPRIEAIAVARADVAALEERLKQARARRDRRSSLLDHAVISIEEVEDADSLTRDLDAQRRAAQSRLDELEAGTRIEELEAQRASVATLDAGLQRIAIEWRDTSLFAPFDGTIAARLIDEGVVIQVGQTVARLVENQHLEARVGLPEGEASMLTLGASYELLVGHEQVNTVLDRVLPEVDARTRTVTAVFRLAPTENGAAPSLRESGRVGSLVRFEMKRFVPERGFWLPIAALTQGSRGLWSCLVLHGTQSGGYETLRADVEILFVDSDRVFVRGTLLDGDRVVSGGTQRVVPGQLVMPSEISSS